MNGVIATTTPQGCRIVSAELARRRSRAASTGTVSPCIRAPSAALERGAGRDAGRLAARLRERLSLLERDRPRELVDRAVDERRRLAAAISAALVRRRASASPRAPSTAAATARSASPAPATGTMPTTSPSKGFRTSSSTRAGRHSPATYIVHRRRLPVDRVEPVRRSTSMPDRTHLTMTQARAWPAALAERRRTPGTAYEGETVAAVLIAEGRGATRTTRR